MKLELGLDQNSIQVFPADGTSMLPLSDDLLIWNTHILVESCELQFLRVAKLAPNHSFPSNDTISDFTGINFTQIVWEMDMEIKKISPKVIPKHLDRPLVGISRIGLFII